MRIAVFCSSSPTIDDKYVELAYELGQGIAGSSNELVTGGGHISMMGAVSRGARDKGGKTVGVIPQALVDIEFADHDNDELHVVETMGQSLLKVSHQTSCHLGSIWNLCTFA